VKLKLDAGEEEECITSVFQLVDLAGSERNKKVNTSGVTFKETVSINIELFYLGNVINILSDEKTSQSGLHIPFKNSKLTKLLANSIGSNCCTLMITCISACPQLLGETINTLRFSQRAKCIKNKPVINHDTKSKLILDLRENVIKLQQELSSLKCESREATVTEQN